MVRRGVDGSSAEEGSAKRPAKRDFLVRIDLQDRQRAIGMELFMEPSGRQRTSSAKSLRGIAGDKPADTVGVNSTPPPASAFSSYARSFAAARSSAVNPFFVPSSQLFSQPLRSTSASSRCSSASTRAKPLFAPSSTPYCIVVSRSSGVAKRMGWVSFVRSPRSSNSSVCR
jgi:hypothetical protein